MTATLPGKASGSFPGVGQTGEVTDPQDADRQAAAQRPRPAVAEPAPPTPGDDTDAGTRRAQQPAGSFRQVLQEAARRASGDPDADDDAPLLFDLGTALGGRRGVIDASLPGFVLVVVNVATSLTWAIIAAVATAAGIAVLRIARKETLQQAFSGVLGIVLAALLAAYTGKAKTFFLPGILINGAYVVATVGSIAARRPLLGYVAAALDRRFAHWRADRHLVRRATYATLVWAAIFAVRFVLQGWLYLHDHVGWLATARLAMGWPLWGVAVMASLLLLQPPEGAPERGGPRRAGSRPAESA
jgi:hypothetical protein